MSTFSRQATPAEREELESYIDRIDNAPETISNNLSHVLTTVFNCMEDVDPALREEACMRFFDLIQTFSSEISLSQYEKVIQVCLRGIRDVPEVSAACSGALHLLISDRDDYPTLKDALLKLSDTIVAEMLTLAQKEDLSDSEHPAVFWELLTSTSSLLAAEATPKAVQLLFQVLVVAKQKRDVPSTFPAGIASVFYAAALTPDFPWAPSMLQDFLHIFHHVLKNIGNKESDLDLAQEICVALSALAEFNGPSSLDQLLTFIPIVLEHTQRKFNISEGVGFLSSVMIHGGNRVEPFANDIVPTVIGLFSSPGLTPSEKSLLLSCLADSVLAVGEKLAHRAENIIKVAMVVADETRGVRVEDLVEKMENQGDADEDFDENEGGEDYDKMIIDQHSLRVSVMDVWTGILQGLQPSTLIPIVGPRIDSLLRTLQYFLRDAPNEKIVHSTWGLVGDIICRLGAISLTSAQKKLMLDFVPLLESALQAESQETRAVARWAQEQMKRF